MKVARHEMPGMCQNVTRPGGHGMIWSVTDVFSGWTRQVGTIIPSLPGRIRLGHFQAFHAWLPSFSPSGTNRFAVNVPLSFAGNPNFDVMLSLIIN
jgi:hypothetical protein